MTIIHVFDQPKFVHICGCAHTSWPVWSYNCVLFRTILLILHLDVGDVFKSECWKVYNVVSSIKNRMRFFLLLHMPFPVLRTLAVTVESASLPSANLRNSPASRTPVYCLIFLRCNVVSSIKNRMRFLLLHVLRPVLRASISSANLKNWLASRSPIHCLIFLLFFL